MENKSKKSIVMGITILTIVTLMLVGLTYAYYRTRIIGNEKEKSLGLVSKKLQVEYSDDVSAIVADNIQPGYSYEKTFTITNTGNDTAYYSIVLENVENTFIRKEDWTYILKSGNEVLKTGVVPKTTTYIDYSEELDGLLSKDYTFIITYADLIDVDQSIDMGSSLSLKVNIAAEIGDVFRSSLKGTLLSAIGNDNVITEPLTSPGKAGSGEVYKESFGTSATVAATTNAYYVYSDSYVLNEDGTYSLVNPKTGLYSDIYNELVGKYVAKTTATTQTCLEYTTYESYVPLGKYENVGKIYQITSTTIGDNATITYIPMTKSTSLVNEAVLSMTEDNYGTSYYFRGNVENNYLNFSGMCWRIVRVQGDGSIKLILADEENECDSSEYSTTNVSSAFIGPDVAYWEYNVSSNYNVTVKNILSKWINGGTTGTVWADMSEWMEYDYTFDAHISEENQQKMQNTNWCVDVKYTHIYDYHNSGVCDPWPEDLNGDYTRYYGAYKRLEVDKKPTLKCEKQLLEGNIGFLTADEVIYAGGLIGTNKVESYLNTNANSYWWTSTPYYYDNGNWSGNYYRSDESYVYTTNGNILYETNMNSDMLDITKYYRPVIVLKPDVLATTKSDIATYGNPGTYTNPYVIS